MFKTVVATKTELHKTAKNEINLSEIVSNRVIKHVYMLNQQSRQQDWRKIILKDRFEQMV